jgi:hypothetical protein
MSKGIGFDWYQATIEDKPIEVLKALNAHYGGRVTENPGVGKMYHYPTGFEVTTERGEVVAKVACDIELDGKRETHAWASTDHAPAFADLVREQWPDRHLVTRADSAIDFIDATAFSRLVKIGRGIAKRHHVRFPSIQDELNPTAGRTQYIGSRKSEYLGRIYEKGWEIVGKMVMPSKLRAVMTAEQVEKIRVPGQDIACHPSELIRAELMARPKQEEGRRALAHASPEEVWTFAKWPHEFVQEALSLNLERCYVRNRRFSSDENSMRWMVRHYAKVLTRQYEEAGDWACVGKNIGQLLADIEQEEKEAGVYRTRGALPH